MEDNGLGNSQKKDTHIENDRPDVREGHAA